jgi:hypothetical protein
VPVRPIATAMSGSMRCATSPTRVGDFSIFAPDRAFFQTVADGRVPRRQRLRILAPCLLKWVAHAGAPRRGDSSKKSWTRRGAARPAVRVLTSVRWLVVSGFSNGGSSLHFRCRIDPAADGFPSDFVSPTRDRSPRACGAREGGLRFASFGLLSSLASLGLVGVWLCLACVRLLRSRWLTRSRLTSLGFLEFASVGAPGGATARRSVF